jgi:hypothetical protein
MVCDCLKFAHYTSKGLAAERDRQTDRQPLYAALSSGYPMFVSAPSSPMRQLPGGPRRPVLLCTLQPLAGRKPRTAGPA